MHKSFKKNNNNLKKRNRRETNSDTKKITHTWKRQKISQSGGSVSLGKFSTLSKVSSEAAMMVEASAPQVTGLLLKTLVETEMMAVKWHVDLTPASRKELGLLAVVQAGDSCQVAGNSSRRRRPAQQCGQV